MNPPIMNEEERKELIEKQKTHQFHKKLAEKVNREDWANWANNRIDVAVVGNQATQIECSKCQGWGWIENPIWTEFYKKYDNIQIITREHIDQVYREYFGDQYDGVSVKIPKEIACEDCGSSGVILKKEGK